MRATFSWHLHPRLYDVAPIQGLEIRPTREKSMILTSAQGLGRQYSGDPIFNDLAFEVRAGERIGLVGPNGAGKTTLIRLLGGHRPARLRAALRPAGNPDQPAQAGVGVSCRMRR